MGAGEGGGVRVSIKNTGNIKSLDVSAKIAHSK